MPENKTKPETASVADFLAAVKDPRRRQDAEQVCALMAEVTGEPPVMWGASIVGFGRYRYQYDSGRSGEWALTGFSPRSSALTLYISDGFPSHQALLARLGPHKTGKACLYLKRLEDVDLDVLRQLVAASVAHMREKYPGA